MLGRTLLVVGAIASATFASPNAGAETPVQAENCFIVHAYTPGVDAPSTDRHFPLITVGTKPMKITNKLDQFSIVATCTSASSDQPTKCSFEVLSTATATPRTLKAEFVPLLHRGVVIGRIERSDNVVREIVVLPISKTEFVSRRRQHPAAPPAQVTGSSVG
jgi:hypothetical protein